MGRVPDPKMPGVLNQLRTRSDARVRWIVLKSFSRFNRAGVRAKSSVEEQPLAASAASVLKSELPVEPAEPPEPQVPSREPAMPVFTTRTFGRLL